MHREQENQQKLELQQRKIKTFYSGGNKRWETGGETEARQGKRVIQNKAKGKQNMTAVNRKQTFNLEYKTNFDSLWYVQPQILL